VKTGKTLTELALELTRQKETKKDYLVSTSVMKMANTGESIAVGEDLSFTVKDLAHKQIAQKYNIPTKYYDMMKKEAPSLLANNVNHWLSDRSDKRMIRTLDGSIRAFLSNSYRPLDNYNLAESILPKLLKTECKVVSSEITDERFYIKAITDRITAEVTKGDIVQSGICISNSEVGLGSLTVEPLVYRLVCTNGMIINDMATRKMHIGRKQVTSVDVTEFYRNETKLADDKAFWMKVEDTVDAVMDSNKFGIVVKALQDAAQAEIKGNPIKVVECTSSVLGLSDNEAGSVLRYLVSGGDLTKYGLANAVTRTSQDIDNYDSATVFEKLGSDIIYMPENTWTSISNAA